MFRTLLLLLVAGVILAARAEAGQGPVNTIVVINGRSPLSVAIGHRYAQWRNIPTGNLIYLDWEAPPIQTDVETFRQRIMLPIAQILEQRKLLPQTTTIAYSSDFPYVIDFKEDLQEDSKVDRTAKQFHQGSLTGMTYLSTVVLTKNPSYSNLGVNFYYRPSLADKLLLETRSFPPEGVWNPQGDTSDTKGVRYFLSTMLAYTSGRGNSLAEVENYLRNGLVADGTYPAGKIYYLTNGDIRAKARASSFQSAIARLQTMGVAGEVMEGVLPKDRGDVMGAMIGAVDYRFIDSGSKVRGGAIVENLTSFGGIMRNDAGQTALSECLRGGAAGSSGTVTEPFAIQAKFPHPMIHVHYAAGCSLAESFYQSVHGPYQLLIVGDPLCRPWATIPTVRVAGLPGKGESVRGELKLTPTASTVSGKRVGRFELYVDGVLNKRCDAGGELVVDTGPWADGSHELRVIGYEDSAIATQGELITRVVSTNHNWRPVEFTIEPAGRVDSDKEVTIRVIAPGAKVVMIYHQQRHVATLNVDGGACTLRAARLGLGPGAFQVAALRGPGPTNTYVSAPQLLEITLPAFPAVTTDKELKPGLRLLRDGQDPVVVEKLEGDWLAQAGVEAGQTVRIESLFRVEADDVYQVQVESSGALELSVDGQPQLTQAFDKPALAYVPLNLSAGVHRLEIKAMPDAARRLNAWFGNRGAQTITKDRFNYIE
jgi:hypothetical protein